MYHLNKQSIMFVSVERDDVSTTCSWIFLCPMQVRALQKRDRQLKSELAQMASAHERQQAVLKRRMESAAASERRLKELLFRQRENREKRRSEMNTASQK